MISRYEVSVGGRTISVQESDAEPIKLKLDGFLFNGELDDYSSILEKLPSDLTWDQAATYFLPMIRMISGVGSMKEDRTPGYPVTWFEIGHVSLGVWINSPTTGDVCSVFHRGGEELITVGDQYTPKDLVEDILVICDICLPTEND